MKAVLTGAEGDTVLVKHWCNFQQNDVIFSEIATRINNFVGLVNLQKLREYTHIHQNAHILGRSVLKAL